ncbi:peptide chain release factor 1 [bacterium]|nr:peptide chain release factor 1 [bacterium]
MANQWDQLQKRHEKLTSSLADPALDNSKRHVIQKELSQLSNLLSKYNDVEALKKAFEETTQMLEANTDKDMLELYQEEIVTIEGDLKEKQSDLDELLFPPNEHDNRSVFLEIRGGTGGQEAALFAGDLLKMYTNYALTKGWRTAVDSSSTTDLGGFREVVLHIKGKDVYGHLKYESGVHRVQRVPATEGAGRIHTSTATVAVLPEAKEVDVTIVPSDLRIDVFRASGAGGQHVNTTDSAVRITHIPSGVVVSCQDERSQHKNKAKAMKRLQSRLLVAHIERQQAEMSKIRKSQVGSGGRSEKVRTYNYPQNRVTDHQVGLTLKKLDVVMEGHMDEIIQALRNEERETRKNQSILDRFGG